jgi:hypothetical protein
MPAAKPTVDTAMIRQALDLLVKPGGVAEIRALKIPGRGKPYTSAGYFLDLDQAAKAAAALDKRKAGGVYVVLNEVNPALLARSPDEATDHLDPLTGDGDIFRRRWLPLDFDPKRPAGISANEAEHCAAEDTARKCAAWLSSMGWPAGIMADSGNGAHLLYRIDLPNDEAGTNLVRDGIAAVAERFSGGDVDIDRKVFNAARIWKLYGTSSRKGHNTQDRPHRVSSLIDVPATVKVVTDEKLVALAAMASKPVVSTPSPSSNSNGASFDHQLDVPRWLSDRGMTFRVKDRPDRFGRTVYVLDRCPFDGSHGGGGEVSVMQGPDGSLAAACMHNSCSGRGWQHFKAAIGKPDSWHYDPPLSDYQGNGQPGQTADQPDREASDGKTKEPPAFTKLVTSAELLTLNLQQTFLVTGVLVSGQPMILGGRSKAMKTSVAVDLVVSLGSGAPFLGRFNSKRVAVAYWSGESGAATIRETARRIADSKGINLAETDCLWSFDLPHLSDLTHLDTMERMIRDRGIEVVVVDPLYLCLLDSDTANGASNVFLMGSLLQGVTRIGQRTNCTTVLLHHFRKSGIPNNDDPATLEELAQSGAAEWARQWLLLQRRSPYQGDGIHSLWMRCGGSAGHSSLWGVTVDEGIINPETFGGRKWDVTISPAADARAESQRDREQRKAVEQERREGKHRDELLKVLRAAPDGDTGKALRERAGLNSANFNKAISVLLQEGRAAQCKITKNRREEDGFRPTGK